MSAGTATPQHLLKPETLAGLANLELVARAVVNGFLTGMHRSPFFGFSQEFAEYRAYSEGDDPRFVDWNVYARTERTYIKRYIGETNTRLVILLDASASMGFGSGKVTKLHVRQVPRRDARVSRGASARRRWPDRVRRQDSRASPRLDARRTPERRAARDRPRASPAPAPT